MSADTVAARPTPKAFIWYSWDDEPDKEWVKAFATLLRGDGVDVTLDRWHLQPGNQLPAFMERAVRENDYSGFPPQISAETRIFVSAVTRFTDPGALQRSACERTDERDRRGCRHRERDVCSGEPA